MRPWRWHVSTVEVNSDFRPIIRLYDGKGRTRAVIWQKRDHATWHTYDTNGTGGENDTCDTIDDAKRHVIASLVVQGWAPGGWRVQW